MSKTVGQWALEMLDNVLHEDEPKTAAEWALEMFEEVVLGAIINCGLYRTDGRQRSPGTGEIADRAGLERATTRDVLSRLVKKELVTTDGDGYWRLAQHLISN